jgi:cyclophilin family peptidyl-prolyl cis-trans isomerase
MRQLERESCIGHGSEPPAVAGGCSHDVTDKRCQDQAPATAGGSDNVHFRLSEVKLAHKTYLSKLRREHAMPNRTATIQTNKGTIKFELLEEDAPKTTENFRLLAEKGYYDGVIFHRVIKGFMIQGGDPDGTGRGGQSAWGGKFADEINASSEVYQRGYKAGTVAMANAGPNTNGSQFFIMHVDYPLPPSYTIFGRVTEGQDVVNAIATSETERGDRPSSEVQMEKVTVE